MPEGGGGPMTTPWHVIQTKLINDGTMTEQGVTRTPCPRHCAACGLVVVAAITDLGFEVAVDPNPVTTAGELDALLAGRETYALLDHGEMVWRNQHRISYRSADEESSHPIHVCGASPLQTHPPPERTHIPDKNSPPPF